MAIQNHIPPLYEAPPQTSQRHPPKKVASLVRDSFSSMMIPEIPVKKNQIVALHAVKKLAIFKMALSMVLQSEDPSPER